MHQQGGCSRARACCLRVQQQGLNGGVQQQQRAPAEAATAEVQQASLLNRYSGWL